ncbi:S1C family serine protease [Clostridium hydrogeniformans]|uniref:S1C family serine protease n=1 Tax=Clostridium hydrogeniformans TaxID=349933 RepID=UPI0004895BDE|nr:trypsin-like peptidase domain-containing protein [Clostridium hydrogeniformans]
MNKETKESEEYRESLGEINFKNRRIRRNMKYAIKVSTLIFIAVVSGALSSYYIIEYKYGKLIRNRDVIIRPITSKTEINQGNYEVNRENIGLINDKISESLVAISETEEPLINGDMNGILGTGVIFDSDGYIVTNRSLLKDVKKKNLYVKLGSHASKPIEAEFIAENEGLDLVVLKISKGNFPYVTIAEPKDVKIGDIVIAIGNPLGEESTSFVSLGIISSNLRRSKYLDQQGKEKIYKVLTTDANINLYNSGGVLVNMKGEVIGMNSLHLSKEFINDGINGAAVSANDVKRFVDSLKSTNIPERASLGFTGGSIKPAHTQGIQGVYVQEVVAGGALDSIDVKPTDIIIEFQDNKVKTFDELTALVNSCKVGDEVKIKVWRNGEILNFNVKLSPRK